MIKVGNISRLTLSLLSLGVVLLGSGVVWKLSHKLEQITTAEQSDPLWISSQLQFELLSFDAELAEYAIGLKSAEDISVRFDILWSRVHIMQQGKMAAIIEGFDIDQTALKEFKRVLETLDPIIQRLSVETFSDVGRQSIAKQILAEISPYNSKFRLLSLNLAQAKSRFMSEFRNGLLSLSYAIAYLGFLILALASIFGGILVIDIRSSKRKSQQLQQLVTEIEASVEMKDKFMSAVSHELRTPLTSILGGISLLKSKFSDELDGGANKLIDIANRNAERLLSLVNDILEVQSLSEGKLTLQKDYVNLTSIIASTVEECSSYANQLGIRLLFISPEDEIIVFVDQSRISQVVNNFLSNAAKFSHTGKTVDIKICASDAWVKVEIIDRGRGIPQKEKAYLFSRFHQINPGTTGALKSSGLGSGLITKITLSLRELWLRETVRGNGRSVWRCAANP